MGKYSNSILCSILHSLLLLSALFFHNATSKTYWRDIIVLKQLKQAISPSSLSPGSCISSWDFSFDPCDSLFSDKFTCGFTCHVINNNISRITELALDQASYSAPLSCISWNLPLLTSLDLSSNNFSGPIPHSLSNLIRLTRLTLSHNSLSGPIPDSLARLTRLQQLLLDDNALVGPIPKPFSGLISLQRLELQGNALSGEFPDLSRLTSLNGIDFSDNLISGGVPTGRLPGSLGEMIMRNNRLQGDLNGDFITKLPQLQVLDLSYNRLSGPVPSSLFTASSLQQLSLSNNGFTSIEVPNGLGADSGLIAVDLGNNHLTGLLPGFMGQMPNLSALTLENNSFTGLIPTQYAFKAVWPQKGIAPFQRLLLGGNFLFGPIPDMFMKLEPGSARINLVDNCLLVCPTTLFFCQGGDQKSFVQCRNTIGPIIP
ncbi:MDIS1-interacting receptor like kinase 1 [Bienertia sinuspersici]